MKKCIKAVFLSCIVVGGCAEVEMAEQPKLPKIYISEDDTSMPMMLKRIATRPEQELEKTVQECDEYLKAWDFRLEVTSEEVGGKKYITSSFPLVYMSCFYTKMSYLEQYGTPDQKAALEIAYERIDLCPQERDELTVRLGLEHYKPELLLFYPLDDEQYDELLEKALSEMSSGE